MNFFFLILLMHGSATPELPVLKGADVELLEAVRYVGVSVERVRQEEFDRAPVAVRASGDICEVAATIRARSVLSRERLAARGRAWADIGLGDTESPAALLDALAADLGGACFDAAGNRLLMSPEILPEEGWVAEENAEESNLGFAMGLPPDGPLVGHLLMHVRQRERAGHDRLGETTDRMLAEAAWAEGEANLVAMRLKFDALGLADEVLGGDLGPAVLSDELRPRLGDDLGDVERQLVDFVYVEGLAQAAEQHRTGGWGALARAMDERKSTRDLLHADREPAASPVPSAPPGVEGMRLIDEDSLGERGIIALIATTTGKDNLGLQAGDGWAGDRLYRWEPADDPAAGRTEWVTRWDSVAASADFDYAFRRALEARYPGRALVDAGEGLRELATGDRRIRVERRATEIRVRIEASP